MSAGEVTSMVRFALRIILRSNAWEAVSAAVASFNETDALGTVCSRAATPATSLFVSTSASLVDSELEETVDFLDSRLGFPQAENDNKLKLRSRRVMTFIAT